MKKEILIIVLTIQNFRAKGIRFMRIGVYGNKLS